MLAGRASHFERTGGIAGVGAGKLQVDGAGVPPVEDVDIGRGDSAGFKVWTVS